MQTKHYDIKDIYLHENDDEYIGCHIRVCGWIKTFRRSGKNLGFMKLTDGTSLKPLQIVFNMLSRPDGYFDQIMSTAKTGMSVSVFGTIILSPKSEQKIEMTAQEYQIYGDVADPSTYPIAKTELSLDYLRTVPHLKCRTDTHLAITKIKSTMYSAMMDYFEQLDYTFVQVPCITDNECESGSNPFIVTTLDDRQNTDYQHDFFRKKTYLTVSGQLHLESIVLGGVQKAFCMTTAFRAEKSTGPRHMAEFWMLEQEHCFGDLDHNMYVNEWCIKKCLQSVLTKCHDELIFLQSKYKPGLIDIIKDYATLKYAITTHTECVKLMLKDIDDGKVTIDPHKAPDTNLYVFREAPDYGDDLSKDHERYITEVLFGGPVFVKYFPAKVKAFYMPIIDPDADIQHVDCFDLLFPEIGEVVGGSQREDNYDKLITRMNDMGIDKSSLEFYADLRKYGTVPHGGSGIGFDRLMMVCTGIFNIRDMVPFPRSYEHCYF